MKLPRGILPPRLRLLSCLLVALPLALSGCARTPDEAAIDETTVDEPAPPYEGLESTRVASRFSDDIDRYDKRQEYLRKKGQAKGSFKIRRYVIGLRVPENPSSSSPLEINVSAEWPKLARERRLQAVRTLRELWRQRLAPENADDAAIALKDQFGRDLSESG